MPSTKEQINAQAMASFRTAKISIGNADVVLRELSDADLTILKKTMYKVGEGGKFILDADRYYVAVDEDPSLNRERWIVAVISPAFSIEEILRWPASLRNHLCEEAKRVNNVVPAAEIAKNS